MVPFFSFEPRGRLPTSLKVHQTAKRLFDEVLQIAFAFDGRLRLGGSAIEMLLTNFLCKAEV